MAERNPYHDTLKFQRLKDTTVYNLNKNALPEALPALEGLVFKNSHFPLHAVGDGYNVIPLDDDETAFVFFRVLPAEIPGNYLTAMANMALRFHLKPGASAAEVLKEVNDSLARNISSLHYLTCFLAILDMRTNRLRFSNAGHAAAVRVPAGSESGEKLLAAGKPLGLFPGAAYQEGSVLLSAGDRLAAAPGKAYSFSCEITGSARQEGVLEQCGLAAGHYLIQTLHDFDQMMVLIRELVEKADENGYPIKFQKNFRLVLLELITNAILHGNKGDSSRKVVAVSAVDSDAITFGVIDEGKGYDDKKIPDPLAPENIGRQQGRGIFIVKHYADEFRLQGRGNCTVVRFLRNSPKTLKA